ncbi:MAG: potassium channel family protein [Mariprofundaceae bacterium]
MTTNLLIMLIITGSTVISMFGTLGSLSEEIKNSIYLFEKAITFFFAVEYFLRIYAAHNSRGYILSSYGIIDLMTWLPLLLFGQVSIALRLLRILRLLKLIRYLKAMHLFFASMADIVDIIFVVLATICIIVLVSGNLIYYIEPETFPNAFIGCWWSLVTMTTVGYGDLIPQSVGGKIEAGVLMLTGITMFAILTGTVSIKLSEHLKNKNTCQHCNKHTPVGAHYCHLCGENQNIKDKTH